VKRSWGIALFGAMSNAESLMIGFGMLGRAILALVVMDIAYVRSTEH